MAQTAVFLMNLGGPRSLAEVEPYLYELFSRPAPHRRPVRPVPAARREDHRARRARPPRPRSTRSSAGSRRWSRGPRRRRGRSQAALGPGYTCHLAMRCGHPNTEEGVREALAAGAERAVALPLYPQYANATTKSSLLELRRRLAEGAAARRDLHLARPRGYLDASAAALRETLARVPAAELRSRLLVVFSAHGLPMSQVRKGDPYPSYIEHSARGTARARGASPPVPGHLPEPRRARRSGSARTRSSSSRRTRAAAPS